MSTSNDTLNKKWFFKNDGSNIPFGYYVDLNDKESGVSFYCYQMLIRTNEMFKMSNLPDTIPEYLFKYYLQQYGFTIFTYVKDSEIGNKEYKEGFYIFSEGCSLGGKPDNYYRPTLAIINNPAMSLSITRDINKDCVLIKNDMMCQGMSFINSRYASMLVENDITLKQFDILSRAFSIIAVTDSSTALSAKDYLDKLYKGELGYITDESLTNGLNVYNNTNNTQSIQALIEYHQYIKSNWYHDLGINSNYNMKRETLSSSEIGVNQSLLLPYVDHMFNTIKECINLVNTMYNLNLSIEYNSSWDVLRDEIKYDLEEHEQEIDNEDNQENDSVDVPNEDNNDKD